MWTWTVGFLLIGFFCMGRSFAYMGIPQLHVFIGEITLASFLLFGPRTHERRWIWVAMKAPQLRRFKIALVLLLVFGAFQVVRGIFVGYSPLLALRDFAFDYYPFYFFIGLWVGLRHQEFLPKLFHFAAWANGLYGTIYVLFLNRITWSFVGFSDTSDPVNIFGLPEFSAVILLGLLSYEKDLRRVWLPLLLNAFVLLGMLVRAEWFAFALGILVWAALTKNLKKAALGGAAVAILLAAMAFLRVSIPGPDTRRGTISVSEILARVIASVDKEAAADYSSDSTDLQMYEANAVWRTLFWAEIWTSVHENAVRILFGYGYGFPLSDLLPELSDASTRTPHNIFFYVLAFTGWTGVIIFAALQIALCRLLYNVHRIDGNGSGITPWVAMVAFALFTPFFEVPQGAIPFYLVTGCACAALFRVRGPAREFEIGTLVPRRTVHTARLAVPGGPA
jgi:hypothetical protein